MPWKSKLGHTHMQRISAREEPRTPGSRRPIKAAERAAWPHTQATHPCSRRTTRARLQDAHQIREEKQFGHTHMRRTTHAVLQATHLSIAQTVWPHAQALHPCSRRTTHVRLQTAIQSNGKAVWPHTQPGSRQPIKAVNSWATHNPSVLAKNHARQAPGNPSKEWRNQPDRIHPGSPSMPLKNHARQAPGSQSNQWKTAWPHTQATHQCS